MSLESSEFSTTDSIEKTPEEKAFTSHHPFVTLMMLCAGPLVFSMAATFHDFMDLFFVGKGYGQAGVAVVGMGALVRFVIVGFAAFAASSVVVKVSSLIAQNRYEDSAQLVVDLIRVAMVSDIILPIVFYFTIKDLLLFIQTPLSIIVLTEEYLFPVLFLMPIISVFNILCGTLLGEARANTCGLFQISALITSLFIADPILIFVFKVKIKYLTLAYFCGQVVFGSILLILYFSGFFSVKPKLSMFLKPFGKEIGNALYLTIPYFVGLFSSVFPPMVYMRYTNMAAEAAGNKEHVAAIMSAVIKPYNLIASLSIGFMTGLIPAGSFCYSAKLFKRTMQLCYYSIPVPLLTKILIVPIMIIKPSIIMKLWLSDPDTLKLCDKLVPFSFYTAFLQPFSEACNAMIMVTKRGILASIPPIARSLSLIAGTFLMYHYYGNRPEKIVFASVIEGVGSFLGAVACGMVPITEILKKADEEEKNEKYTVLY